MKWIKNTIRGQITLPVLITLGGMIAGSIIWITNISAEGKQADSEIRERVIKLETTIVNTDMNVSEIRDDLKDIKKALRIQ